MLSFQLAALVAMASVLVAGAVAADGKTPESQYTIVGSQVIRFNSEYHVAVSLHNATAPAQFRLTIENGANYSVAQEVTVQPWSTETATFKFGTLPKPASGSRYKLIAEGLGDLKFKNETHLHVSAKEFSILVQSDKALYKPGDLIRFRCLVIDERTRPVQLQHTLQVHVLDGATNRVKQWTNQSTTDGVFTGEFQLSDAPVLGQWQLHFEALGETKSHGIEVAEYVLPTFETHIETAEHVLYADGVIRANIRGKYTFGKPVHGEANVTLRPHNTYYGEQIEAKRTVRVLTKGAVEFDLVADLHLPEGESERSLQMDVQLEEEFTGRQHSASASITVHRHKYTISRTSYNYQYEDGRPFDIDLQVLRYDQTPVRNVTVQVWYSSDFGNASATHMKEYVTDGEGRAKVRLELPLNQRGHFVMAKYADVTEGFGYFPSMMYRVPEPSSFQVTEIGSEGGHNVGDKVKFDLESRVPLKHFTYQVVARGDVLVTKSVELEGEGATKTGIEFELTYEMMPSVKMVVYTIREDGTVDVTTNYINATPLLTNSIELTPSVNETEPGTEIDLKITTPQHSFVGLLAVDQSVLLLRSGNDLTESEVTNTLDEYGNKYIRKAFGDEPHQDYNHRQFQWSPTISSFENHGLFVLSNIDQLIPKEWEGFHHRSTPRPLAFAGAIQHEASPVAFHKLAFNSAADAVQPQAPTIRKDFPETWIWDTLTVDSSEGVQNFHKKVPDTVTSWVITAFSLNPETGLGLTKQSTKLNVFKPFFVSLSLPYSVKRGEVVSIPIVVFNYLDTNADAEVTLHNVDGEFEFADLDNDVSESYIADAKRSQQLYIKSQDGAGVTFAIRPLKVGPLTIKVTAVSALAGDGLELILPVYPEGVPQYVNKALLVDLRSKSALDATTLTVDVPADAVPDSTRVEISAIGDVMGSTIKNLNRLIRMPSGCGEQNMLNFVPNIVIRNYLKAVNRLDEEVELRSRLYMEIGYQRQLTFRHHNGSFSAFGTSDSSGSTWLTAFVARSFRQAAEYITIEERIINDTLRFLSDVQHANGSFPEVGTVIHKSMQSGAGSGVALTAYTLLAFLENRHVFPEYSPVIDKAIAYLVANVDTLDDVYAMAVAAYALQLADHSGKAALLRDLDAKAVSAGDHRHWSNGEEVTEPKRPEVRPFIPTPALGGNSVSTEITAYALLAHLQADPIEQTVPIMKWLLAQRNAEGGFASTQDTIVGLQALATIAARITFGPEDDVKFVVTADADDAKEQAIAVTAANANVLQQVQLAGATRAVTVSASGSGFALLSLAYRYYVSETGAAPRFKVVPTVVKGSHESAFRLDVCASFVASPEASESNMAVMEVEFPSGYTLDADKREALRLSAGVRKVETRNGDTVVVLYFNNLGAEAVCPSIEAVRTHKVEHLKPAAVTVYDYYDTTRKSREFYSIAGATAKE